MQKDKIRYEIIDNFLDEENFKLLKDNLESSLFPWYYSPKVAYLNYESETFYFYHLIAFAETSSSFCFDLIRPILNKLDYEVLIRIKANLYTNMGKLIEDPPHKDFNFSHKGAIFFINTNNAPTILQDGIKIEAIENRLVKFDPSLLHNSTHPTDTKKRITINFNYI